MPRAQPLGTEPPRRFLMGVLRTVAACGARATSACLRATHQVATVLQATVCGTEVTVTSTYDDAPSANLAITFPATSCRLARQVLRGPSGQLSPGYDHHDGQPHDSSAPRCWALPLQDPGGELRVYFYRIPLAWGSSTRTSALYPTWHQRPRQPEGLPLSLRAELPRRGVSVTVPSTPREAPGFRDQLSTGVTSCRDLQNFGLAAPLS